MHKLKFFEVNGHYLRMLEYQINLAKPELLNPNLISDSDHEFIMEKACKKPDNSEEKCNLVIKNIKPDMTDKKLEEYFAS